MSGSPNFSSFLRRKSSFFRTVPQEPCPPVTLPVITKLTPEELKTPLLYDIRKLSGIHGHIANNDLRKVKQALSDINCDINKPDAIFNLTPLHIAVDSGIYDAVALILNTLESVQKPNLDISDTFGRTPLMIAVMKGHADIAHLLLKSHASPNAQDLIGCTACHYAIYLGDVSCFRLLMDSGASTAIIDKTGLTLLHHAVHKSRSEMSLQLLQTFPPAWVNSQYTGADGNQTTLLHAAATKSLNKVVKALIELGADLDAKDTRNRTPLECVDYEIYEPEIVKLLTSNKLTVNRSAEGFVLNKMEARTDNIVDTSVTTLVLETTASKSLGELNVPANSAETQSSVEESKLKALRDEVEQLQGQLIIAITARAEADIRTSNALEQLESLRREYAISNRKRAADVPIQTVVKPVSGLQNDSSSQIVNLETSVSQKSDEIKQLRSSLTNERTLNEKLKEEVERLGKELSFVKGTNSSLEILLANERDMTRQLKATTSCTEFEWKDINKKLDRLYSVLM